ncbi:MAG: hypothetical protein QW597_04965 [Thermoplasmataceae archaeon]
MVPDNVDKPGSRYTYLTKGILSDLFDAIIYSKRSSDKKEDTEKVQKELSTRLVRTDELLQSISRLIKQYIDEVGLENLKENLDPITSFATTALDQVKSKLNKIYSNKVNEITGEIESSRTLSLKSLEAFVSGSYFRVHEKGIILKMVEGGYEARAKYLCDGDIEYDFSLNARNIEIFRDVLFFSALIKSFKIPVGTAGTWISKEPAIDYERLDKYAMASAELSGSNLICNFSDTSKKSNFKFIYSNDNKGSTLSVDYTDPTKQVDVTSQPALNKNLDMESLESAMKAIFEAIHALEVHRLKLLKLSVAGNDILAGTDYIKVLQAVIGISGQDYVDFFSAVIKNDFQPTEGLEEAGITRDYVASRIKSIGDVANEIQDSLDKISLKK